VFIRPEFGDFALAGVMVLQTTVETERTPTETLNVCFGSKCTQIHDVSTFSCTLTLVFLVVNKTLFDELVLLLKVGLVQNILLIRVSNFAQAFRVSRTSRIDALE